MVHAGLRGPGRVDPQGRQPARQCRSRRIPSSKDPEERSRIARVFERGLTKPSRLRAAGPALAARRPTGQRWRSREMEDAPRPAVPGARRFSPVGYRLPLGTLPYVPPAQYPYIVPVDPVGAARAAAGTCAILPTGGRPPKPPTQRAAAEASFTAASGAAGPRRAGARRDRRRGAHRACRSSRATAGSASSCRRSSARGLSRTDRRGRERGAASIGLPVHIEGYAPPHDPRINVIRVAPDPGVIEVNIHPASNWARLRRHHHGDLRGGAPVAASAPTSS